MQAIPPLAKLVGPVLPSTPKALPDNLEAFVAGGKDNGGFGTVVASFGSQVIMESVHVDMITIALGLLKCRVVWKPPGNLTVKVGLDIIYESTHTHTHTHTHMHACIYVHTLRTYTQTNIFYTHDAYEGHVIRVSFLISGYIAKKKVLRSSSYFWMRTVL